MSHYAALAALLAWLAFYGWKISVALGFLCGVIALFYGAALEGRGMTADARVARTFSALVLALSLMMLGVLMASSGDEDEMNISRICNGMQC